MPAFLRVAITWFIRAAFRRRASAAVGASVCTPVEMVAMSGRRLTSPDAERLRVVVVGGKVVGGTGAGAVGASAAPADPATISAPMAAARKRVFMGDLR